MPGSIIDNMPPRPDDIQRRQRDAERRAREQAAAKSGQAMQIGAGGITVTDGGSISIEGTGALHVGSGALDSAGSITAATDITAGGTVKGASLVSTGGAAVAGDVDAANVVASGQMQSNGSPFKSQPSYNYNPTTAYEALYIDGVTYEIGYVASTRASKKNLEPYPHELVQKLLTTEVHHGHYLRDADDSPKKTFLIVEDLAEAGFGPDIAVRDPETGAPRSINYAHLVPGLLAAIQHLQAQIDDLKSR